MAKKIFDISPKKIEKIPEKKELPSFQKPKFQISLPKISLKGSFFIFFLILAIIGFLISFRFSKAKIKIWPETETSNFREKIEVNLKIEKSDFKNKILTGKIFEAEKNFSEEFSATGKSLKKAEGIIRLYNAFSTQPETWLAGTRFISSDGKLFKSKDKISVPGAEIKNGKIVPSFVDVPVIAAEGGSEYNIGPSHFSILAFKGTPRYFKFYGESFEPMKGGGEFPQVKKEDLERAENSLTEKAKTELKEILKNQIPSDFVFLDNASEIKILNKSSSAKEGQEVDKFNFQIQAKIRNISFKKDEAEELAKKIILSQIPKGKSIFKESLKIDYSIENIDFDLGKMNLSLAISIKTYPEIDLNSLKEALREKSLNETKIFLENQPNIKKSEISIFPFWLNHLPKDLEKIEINLILD